MLCHDVYFTLEDDSADAQEKLVAGCKKYLSNHPGTVWFAAGTLVTEHSREVNDRGFHVALHLVFEDKAAHDKYQQADGHHKFIEEFKDNWKSVRVFDSWLQATSHAETPEH
ncbi:MAG: Dabb family protein [Candidatus Nealsonbacteria bacterium]|nr:Dabb family protein [Candidatus Nealsonbacteria bacterium]